MVVDSRHLRLAPRPLRSHNPAERRRGWSREDRLGRSIVRWHTFVILCILLRLDLNAEWPPAHLNSSLRSICLLAFMFFCVNPSLMLFTNVLIFRIPACRDFIFATFCIFCNLAYNKLLKGFSVTTVLSTCDCELCPLIV